MKKDRLPADEIHSNKIRAILKELKITQAQFADECLAGNNSFASQIINGHRKQLSLPVGMRISKYLGKPIEYVFVCKPKPKPKKQKE